MKHESDTTDSYWMRELFQILNIAHRGGGSLGPENTLTTAAKGLASGAHAWELDVQLTSDHVPVVLHDHSLIRTSNAQDIYPKKHPWYVHEFTLEQLRRLDFGSWFFKDTNLEFPDSRIRRQWKSRNCHCHRIATLRQALRFSENNRWPVIVELKTNPAISQEYILVENVLDDIRRTETEDLVLISSFQHDLLVKVKQLFEKLPTAMVTRESHSDPQGLMTRINAQVYFASYEIVTSELLAALNIANIPLITWTVNRSEDMDTMIRMGVQRILTDYPQILSKKIKPNPFHP